MHILRRTTLLAVTVGVSLLSFPLMAQDGPASATSNLAVEPSAAVRVAAAASAAVRSDSRVPPQQLRETDALGRSDRQQPPSILPNEFVPSHLANRAMTVMGILIAACIGAIWYGQRHSRAGRLRSSSSDLQVIDTLSIAPRCCVHLLSVGGQKYLVARDQAGIKSVTAVSAFASTLDDLTNNPEDSAQDVASSSLKSRSWARRSDQWSSTLNR